jgi:phosphoribosylformylglycinamidine cyclo-ligase
VTTVHKTVHRATYKEAGVDVEAGDALVDWLIDSRQKQSKSKKQKEPHADRVVAGIGGFAALFRAKFKNMKSPCLVSSTDGVGTKVKLAAELERYEGIGQDLVAMCVNDLACVGAQPLFFLDYFATGKLDLKMAKVFLQSVREACHASDCALIGGETAEMPGVYAGKDFDCAGFAVGVVDEKRTLGAHKVKVGDLLVGVESSGFHSNGYSLLRKIFAPDFKEWADVLLKPTHLYPKLVLEVLAKNKGLHAVAHVTGGGLDNLLRVIPDGTALDLKPWSVPAPFLEVKHRGQMEWSELLRTLNCGVGLVLMVDAKTAELTRKLVRRAGFRTYDLGRVVKSKEKNWHLNFNDMDEAR